MFEEENRMMQMQMGMGMDNNPAGFDAAKAFEGVRETGIRHRMRYCACTRAQTSTLLFPASSCLVMPL